VTGAISRIGRYQVVTGKTNELIADQIIGIGNDDGDINGARKSRRCAAKNTAIEDNGGVPIILSYCIFRPRQLHDQNKPPLLCLHGGPSIPSNYLLPIVNGVTDRAVIFYDQWGCGKSSRPQLLSQVKPGHDGKTKMKAECPPFSIPTMVEHLRQLIEEHWKLKRFHLLGHSFGGLLAYEYLLTTTSRRQENSLSGQSSNCDCCSLILSSTPTSAVLVQSESERLFRILRNQRNNDKRSTDSDSDNDYYEDDDTDKSSNISSERQKQQIHKSMINSEEFHQTHECRLPNPPLALMNALGNMGPTPWRGIQAIDGYEAEEVDESTIESNRIPSLLMRGEYDFCTEACMKGWKERLDGEKNKTEETVLSNCSHYAMLEDENQYGAEILRFVKTHDADVCSTS